MTQVTLRARDIKQLNSVTVTLATSCTVSQLKDSLASAGKWPRPGMRIAFRDCIAEDDKTLESLGVTNNSLVGVYLDGIPMRMVEPNKPPPAEPVQQESTVISDILKQHFPTVFRRVKANFGDIYSDEEIAVGGLFAMQDGTGFARLENEQISRQMIQQWTEYVNKLGETEGFRTRWQWA